MLPRVPLPAETRKVILICPLDWGLGHIARDLPLIKEFKKNGHRVIVAASSQLIQWLKTESPGIETVLFPGPTINYGPRGFLVTKLILQLPRLWFWYYKEKKITAGLVKKYRPQLIISDNRYGVRHPSVFSVIITHQLMIKLPHLIKWMEYPLHLVIKNLLHQFNQCWVPDFNKENSLAGDLVHKYAYPKNVTFIGPLSRFDDPELKMDATNLPEKTCQNKNMRKPFSCESHPGKNLNKLYTAEQLPSGAGSLMAIISGPEPHRTHLENKLNFLIRHYSGKVCLIRGTDFNKDFPVKKTRNIEIYNHLPTGELFRKIMGYEIILGRSGYSTIMDMCVLNKTMVMVPTPGQTEQEYLAKYHDKRNHFRLVLNRKNLSNPFGTLSIFNRVIQKLNGKPDSKAPSPQGNPDKQANTQIHNSSEKDCTCPANPNFREILKNILE